jgi:hypothetical protein
VGTIDVLLFDNGNQRVLDSVGTLCGPATTPCESRVPILHLDETAKTAYITWVDKLAPLFSFFGGSFRQPKNGNIEFDECAATPPPATNAAVFEVTKTTPPVTVWQMQISGQYAYRAFRIPSLYPGVQCKVSAFVIWGERHRDARESFEQGGFARGLSYSRPFCKAIARES